MDAKIRKLRLIPDWKKCHRFWSVRISALGAAIMGLFTIWPDSALQLWAAMPDEVRTLIPHRIVSGLAAFVFVMTTASRIVKQRPKDEQAEAN
jgi:hypothetical protein